jgi:transcriptional regulator with XRE-family HTH domain
MTVNDGFRIDPAKFNREMARRGLTGKRLAEISGVDKSTISAIRRGNRPIRPTTQHQLLSVLLSQPLIEGAELLA